MKKIILFFIVISNLCVTAQYQETMNPKGLTVNLKKDFQLIDDGAKTDQTFKFQKAIDYLFQKGGGNLVIPKGKYLFNGAKMKSNVHILIEKGTIIKPLIRKGSKGGVITFDSEEPKGFIENVSIRGLGGRYVIDYSDAGIAAGPRFISCRNVRNFLISDANILDSRTPYSAMNFVPSKEKGADKWEVFRPTNGIIRDCSAFDSSAGYGLVQAHGAANLLFENLYSKGGVTLRFETGAGGQYAGIFEIYGKNIVNEEGSEAVVLFPHAVQNGNIYIDGVKSISSSWAVAVGGGGEPSKKDKNNDPNAKPGIFGSESYIKNVHAVFGTKAQIGPKNIHTLPKEYLKEVKVPEDSNSAVFIGSSTGVVRNAIQNNDYKIVIENVTDEGFKYNKGIVYPDGTELQGSDRWKFSKTIPGIDDLADKKSMKNYKSKLKKTSKEVVK